MATALTQTTLTGQITASQTTIPVASATGISAPVNNIAQKLYIIDPNGAAGELVTVVAVSGLQVTISRLDEFKATHASGSIVVIGINDPTVESFHEYNPVGVPSATGASNQVTPFINVVTGEQWLVGLTGAWVPGWNNGKPLGSTTLVASAAGVILPSGPLFHVNGTAAITGFTIPVGFAGGKFTVIPDAVFTWTAAGNIALAGTAVVNKALTFVWDANASKWYPNYIA